MTTKTDDIYSSELLAFTSTALLYLAVNNFHTTSLLYQTKKLSVWLNAGIKKNRFSRVIARDLRLLQAKARKAEDVSNTIRMLNKTLSAQLITSDKLNFQNLFDRLKSLESKGIRAEFIDKSVTQQRVKASERLIFISSSELELLDNPDVKNSIILFLVGDICDVVKAEFVNAGFDVSAVESSNALLITELNPIESVSKEK